MEKTLNAIYSILFYLVVVTLVVFIILPIMRPTDSIKYLGFNIYMTSDTHSMEPMLKYNDIVIVKKTDFNSLKVGDVIAYMGSVQTTDGMEKAPIMHQIIEIGTTFGEKSFVTKGINNENKDIKPTTIDGVGGTNEYIGELGFKLPFLGYIIAFLKSIYGIMTIAINVIIYLIIRLLERETDDEEVVAQS